jgi:seryl-tRNA synthetase
MLDIKFVRNNPEIVKQNIKNKFQDKKLPLVDEVIEKDAAYRASKVRADELRSQRNSLSKQIGGLMAKGEKDFAFLTIITPCSRSTSISMSSNSPVFSLKWYTSSGSPLGS